MKIRDLELRLSVLTVSVLGLPCTAAQPTDLWIETVTIVSPEREPPMEGASVPIHGERIVGISTGRRSSDKPTRNSGPARDGAGAAKAASLPRGTDPAAHAPEAGADDCEAGVQGDLAADRPAR